MPGDDRRERLLDELRSERGGLDAHELAQRLGVHANTVRWHLGVLADRGLVTSRPEGRRERGRPRIAYSLSAEAARQGRDEHRLLAAVLAGAAAAQPDGSARAEEAGRAWGRYLVRRPAPSERVDDAAATAEVVALLDEEGFEPEAADGKILIRRCPFHELAETHPQIVCAVHRGLMEGAYEELRSEIEVGELEVFPQPDLCVVHLTAPRP
jgi:predicted ArsR family transcriptional regulator